MTSRAGTPARQDDSRTGDGWEVEPDTEVTVVRGVAEDELLLAGLGGVGPLLAGPEIGGAVSVIGAAGARPSGWNTRNQTAPRRARTPKAARTT